MSADLFALFAYVLLFTTITPSLGFWLLFVVPITALMLIRQWIRNREWRKRHTVFIDERGVARRL